LAERTSLIAANTDFAAAAAAWFLCFAVRLLAADGQILLPPVREPMGNAQLGVNSIR
jgi:hypothetical protein